MSSTAEVDFPIPIYIADIPVAMTTQILPTFDSRRLTDDANENHNYIACQIIL